MKVLYSMMLAGLLMVTGCASAPSEQRVDNAVRAAVENFNTGQTSVAYSSMAEMAVPFSKALNRELQKQGLYSGRSPFAINSRILSYLETADSRQITVYCTIVNDSGQQIAEMQVEQAHQGQDDEALLAKAAYKIVQTLQAQFALGGPGASGARQQEASEEPLLGSDLMDNQQRTNDEWAPAGNDERSTESW